jgi:hypothetical protein
LADYKRRLLKRHFAMTLGSSCQLSGDTGEHTGQAGADGGSRGDDHDRDKRGNQTIFNGGDARLVSEETGEEDFHRIGSFVGANFQMASRIDTIESANIVKRTNESIRLDGLTLEETNSLNGLMPLPKTV